MRQWNENVATASVLLMFAAFPTAVVTELLGQTDLARFSLWAVIGSFVGIGIAFAPEAGKEYSIAHQDIRTRDFIADRISIQYPEYDELKLARSGARFMRQNVGLPVDSYYEDLNPIDARHTYLTLLYLMEHKAMFLKQDSNGSLRWVIDWDRMPRFERIKTEERGKCFSCLYWSDPYDEAEDFGKDSDELNCAVNPLHLDTQNGCRHHCDDWRKADLWESWAVRS